MKVILGIDPGLATIGYGVIQWESLKFRQVSHGVLSTRAGDEIGARLLQIHEGFKNILGLYRPDEAGVETLYFAKNSKSAIPVAQARGVILLALTEAGIPFSEYTPLEVKQAVIGRGKADKRQIQEVLKLLFGLKSIPRPNHAADALAVAFCHANYANAGIKV